MSQTIHDTTAQSAYTLGLALEGAIDQARPLDAELTRRLEVMSDLSLSTMWALRHPIDGGAIFNGGALSEVLTAHVDTFTAITSIPAELVQAGDEPELSTITKSLLFSIAHNALTNAFRHSGAGSVMVFLDFEAGGLSMSVADDGVGLPEDYAAQGHGFRNMSADAGRLGGRLEVESSEEGTVISCTVPYEQP
jgi:signal transduction histidine kinase